MPASRNTGAIASWIVWAIAETAGRSCLPDWPARANPVKRSRSGPGLSEPEHEPVGLSLHRGIEDVLGVIVGSHAEHVALAVQYETGALEIGLDRLRIDPVQLVDDGAG